MTAQDFQSWMEQMQFRSAAQVVRALGVSRNLAQRWLVDAEAGKDLDIKRHVALAMAAAAAKLDPWGSAQE